MNQDILVINAGSSSLKYQLIDPVTEKVLAKGICERIGLDGTLTHKAPGREPINAEPRDLPTHAEAIRTVLDILVDPVHGVIPSVDAIRAVGHRVLHGGKEFTSSCLIDDACIAAIRRCIPLGPLHNPANLLGIEACRAVMPDTPQVAVFDTAFHMTMPPRAYLYGIPYEYYEQDDVRRYGFHGTSHRFVSSRCIELLGSPEHSRIVTCHLGGGASLAAIVDGKVVDTSMGLGPLGGFPMGTRSGDLDPTILQYLMERRGYSIDEIMTILNKKSGVLGLSGLSSDFRDLIAAKTAGNERASLAIEKFAYEIRKYIGAYTAAMGGLDAVVLTGGVGENQPIVRRGILSGLEFLGIELDEERTEIRRTQVEISLPSSRVKVFVIPTNEELIIAQDTAQIVGLGA